MLGPRFLPQCYSSWLSCHEQALTTLSGKPVEKGAVILAPAAHVISCSIVATLRPQLRRPGTLDQEDVDLSRHSANAASIVLFLT